MKREIKFRQPIRNIKGEFKEYFYWGFIDNTFITPANQCNGNDTRTESQQFTGLKDNNNKGKEIYEGDVVYLAGYGDYIVEFPFIELYNALNEGDVGKIKGNIYENPELLN